jgi:hypothetical protein
MTSSTTIWLRRSFTIDTWWQADGLGDLAHHVCLARRGQIGVLLEGVRLSAGGAERDRLQNT